MRWFGRDGGIPGGETRRTIGVRRCRGTRKSPYLWPARFAAILVSRALDAMEQFIDQDGFALCRGILAADECAALCRAIGPVGGAGRRGLLAKPLVAKLARSLTLVDLVRPHVGGEPFPVRAIFFNKSPDANWLVAWHQDVTIAVRERKEVPGFGPWTVKDGIPHVQPPIDVLERMLAVRLHFDDTDETNGALRVLPGSHRLGRLSPEQIGICGRIGRNSFVVLKPAMRSSCVR